MTSALLPPHPQQHPCMPGRGRGWGARHRLVGPTRSPCASPKEPGAGRLELAAWLHASAAAATARLNRKSGGYKLHQLCQVTCFGILDTWALLPLRTPSAPCPWSEFKTPHRSSSCFFSTINAQPNEAKAAVICSSMDQKQSLRLLTGAPRT